MIKLKNVSKYFKTKSGRKYILKDMSIEIPPHTNIGILGRNGTGKSTIMRMLGQIDFPNSGTITSNQSFSWPLGLGGGFVGNMSGRANVKFVSRLYGKSSIEIESIIDFVKEFSELKDYFDMPIKTYSSGMKSRLSFGLSLSFDFDYMLIDETLSVGDAKFRKKSKEALLKKIETCNVLLVSHDLNTLKEICDAGIVVNNGKIEYFDNIDDAIIKYGIINK
ncbi:MAG: Capsular polysaccharide ABC transporter, ATP-binding protein KpsT [uncultured Sulfurovum sp.]|uniref:Capsular polysaccharide ABC transporter, ATP-binding protein KpsT n=1 Tax=uncultured Sulfurovum sp. TaxID=269237 RepID=A0A6S6T9D5_9BACT|nr:MAG: Capsular polysaccharide ABC transporter, ATP-binding protein KpsT [uncultured Sulfurovum sp.]